MRALCCFGITWDVHVQRVSVFTPQPVRAGVEPAPATGAALNNAAAAAAAAIEAMEDVDDACVHACKSTRLLLCSLAVHPRSVDARASGYAEAVVSVDNYTSKAHTVLQVRVVTPRLLAACRR